MKDIFTIPVEYKEFNRKNVLTLLEPLRNLDHEECIIVYINGDYGIGTIECIQDVTKNSQRSSTDVNMRKIFETLQTKNVNSIMLVHNHPDERYTPIPSPNDINFTARLQDFCEDFYVDVIDSLILSKNSEFYFDDHDMIIYPFSDLISEPWFRRQIIFRPLSKIFPKLRKYCFF